nr:hypothetical protein [Tanacetum cinerariifolium]
MYDFLQLPVWTAMVVCKGDLIPDNQRLVNRTTPHLAIGQLIPKKTATQRNIEKPNPKMPKLGKRKRRKPPPSCPFIKPIRSSLMTPPRPNRRVQPSTHAKHDDIQENVVVSDAHSIHSGHDEGNDKDTVVHRFGPCFFRACKELVTHLATLDEEEFLSGLLNVELNKEYVDLCNRSDTQLEELNRLRNDLQRILQASDGLSKKLVLLENAHSYYTHRERELMDRLKGMEIKRDEWRQIASEQVEKIKKLEDPPEPKSK